MGRVQLQDSIETDDGRVYIDDVYRELEEATPLEEPVIGSLRPTWIHFDEAPKNVEESGLTADGFEFDDSQKHALKKLTSGKHVCLIGAAGTGKTTMVRHAMGLLIYKGDPEQGTKPLGIRRLSGEQGPSIAICAFTGIATQVIRATLPQWLQPACKTIHTLLEYKPANTVGNGDEGKRAMFVPTRTALNKLDHDLIVIDESSMLGLDLWHNLVDALRPGTVVILIGDLNQLKPVADATFFAYALSAAVEDKEGWTLAALTTIHRQKEAAANKIIEAAHNILNGKNPIFDNPQTDPNWRIIGFELPPKADAAHAAIVSAVEYLRKAPTPEIDPLNPGKYIMDNERHIFEPYEDLLLTAGNGLDFNDSKSFVQQVPLNATLSRIIEKPSEEHPVYIIDAGRDSKKFAVGHRVMATKNESPVVKDRVTNGLIGRIIDIRSNANWKGNKSLFGTEKEVNDYRTKMAQSMMGNPGNPSAAMGVNLEAFSLAMMDTTGFDAKEKEEEERQASHIVSVRFANGAERTYRSAIDVGDLQLAYAITTHKAQGSQADTVIVVVHHAVRAQLSREWFYTAVTRAKRRVVVLYTRMGLSIAVNRQQIHGATMAAKVARYREVMTQGNVFVRLRARQQITELVRYDDGSLGREPSADQEE